MIKHFFNGIPLLILTGFLALFFSGHEWLQDIRSYTFDRYQRLKPRTYQDSPIKIVAIDDSSLELVGQWPWPRILTGELIRQLTQAGAGVIALNILFSESDRTSPKDILKLWPEIPEIRMLMENLDKLPDHDQALADTLEKSPAVASLALLEENNQAEPKSKATFAFTGKNPASGLSLFQGAVGNLPIIESKTRGLGVVNIPADKDGVLRRVPLVFRFRQDRLLPSLAFEAVRIFEQSPQYLIRHTGDGGNRFWFHSGIQSLQAGNRKVPVDFKGTLWLYDTGPIKERVIPAWKILGGEVDPASLNNKILFLGLTAAGLKNTYATPLHPVMTGVEIHAQVAEQIYLGDYLIRPDWAEVAEAAFLFFAGLLIILTLPRLQAVLALFAVLTVAGIATGLAFFAFLEKQWLVDPLFPVLGIGCVYLSMAVLHFIRMESEKRQIRFAFNRYLSPALVEKLVRSPEQLKLGGELKKLTLFFADIRGFTTISEGMTAQELTRFMNRYMTPMTEIILAQNGTIDKYIGDCIMAFWNAPLDDPQHAMHAAQAALNMKAYLVEWNKGLYQESEEKGKLFTCIHIGIGINTGECCVGNMGSEQRFDYSVIGDEVNQASRFEGLTKHYGVDILIGEQTANQIQDFALLEVDRVCVLGKKNPVRIYALLGGSAFKNDPGFLELEEKHRAMLAAYRDTDWQRALEALNTCLKLDTPKMRLRYLYESVYGERIREFQTHPPAPDWEGVSVINFK